MVSQKDSIRATPENFYHKIIEEVRDYAMLLLDADGKILNWNPGAKAIKGYDAEEIMGRDFRIFYADEDRTSGLPDRLLALATAHGRASHEGWRIKKDGSKFWGSVVITALHDSQGRVIGFSKLTRDLTERKQSEERLAALNAELLNQNHLLRRSEALFQRMVTEVEDYAIILLDNEGNIRHWNRGAEKIKGYTEDEILGKNFRIFYHPEDQQRGLPEQLLDQARRENKATHEGWRVRRDGTRFWGYIVITALHDDAGNIIGFSKVTRDLTQKKEYEGSILQRNRELEDYAHVASHDLQEPLRKIMIFSGMLAENPDPEKLPSYIGKIRASALRMSKLIRDILEYSQANDAENLKTDVDLDKVVRDIIDDLEIAIADTSAVVEWAELPRVRANPIQIQQLFSNLIQNALKFGRDGTRVSIVSAAAAGNRCAITISDNGPGFHPKYKDRVFRMFQRLGDGAGTGIGLALCKRIVENHGGSISVDPQPGTGAAFTFTLPLA